MSPSRLLLTVIVLAVSSNADLLGSLAKRHLEGVRHWWYWSSQVRRQTCLRKGALVCYFQPTTGNRVLGQAHFLPVWKEWECKVRVVGRLFNLKPNAMHGWHIHKFGDLRFGNGSSTGGHFVGPIDYSRRHSLPGDPTRHWGDLGNLKSNAKGEANQELVDDTLQIPVIAGRGMIIHALKDKGPSRQPSGAAGARLAACVIGHANPDV